MAETVTDINATQEGGSKRERSSIAFPYFDLADAFEVVRAIHGHAATGTCEEAQLAAWISQSSTSSGFRGRLTTARLFGLIEGGSSALRCTELGLRVVDSKQERAAKVDAFLRVPLFATLYERFKATVLPSQAAALEREIASLGVAEKQKDRARQVFLRSAEQANFFEHGKDRLVKPGVGAAAQSPKGEENSGGDGGGGGDGSDGLGRLDPLILALLKKIPMSKDWPAPQRLRWFKTFAMNVSHVYDEADKPVDLEIKLEVAS